MLKHMKQLFIRLSAGHIISAWSKQKYTVAILILQVAITFAATSNALYIAVDRYQLLEKPSGLDETNTFALTSSGFGESFDPKSSIEEDLLFLRELPYVVDVVKTNSFPFSNGGQWFYLQLEPGENKNRIQAASYKLDEHGISAFGLNLIAGKNFEDTDVLWQEESDSTFPSPAIITTSTAKNLFNTENWEEVLGKTIFVEASHPVIITGVIETLQAPWVDWIPTENAFISPVIVPQNSSRYVIRTQEGELQSSIPKIEQALALRNKERVIRNIVTISSARNDVYGPDIAAMTVLLTVIAVLILVAAMGITGLTSFNIIKRRKQIGIRRALGATKLDIVYYFVLENALQMSIAIILGIALAISLNVVLVTHYGFAKLPYIYLLYATLVIYLLGLLATLKPALKTLSFSTAEVSNSN